MMPTPAAVAGDDRPQDRLDAAAFGGAPHGLYERRIRYVMVRGVAHVPEDAIGEYRAQAS